LRRIDDHGRPVIVMSRLAGASLGGRPLDEEQVVAVAAALDRLHAAVPPCAVDMLPRRLWYVPEAVQQMRKRVEHRPPGLGPAVRRALVLGADWLVSADVARLCEQKVRPVLGNGDGNIANFLWDGTRCVVVDFEDSGGTDRAFEVADLVEHVACGIGGVLDGDALLRHLALDSGEARRAQQARRLLALYWLIMLLPGAPGHDRNPVGSVDGQAERLLHLLS
jgi:Ser/Thr protein kinase RdoA (MazF antagonist)